jgi:hypothetical protein
MQVAKTHVANVSYTYSTKVFALNGSKCFLANILLVGNITFASSMHAILCSLMDSTILSAKNTLDHKRHYILQKTLIWVIFKNNLWTNKKLAMTLGALVVCVAFYWLVPFSNGLRTQLIMQNEISYTYNV